MALMNGGELLMRALLKEGVKQVFGIPGSQTSTFIDAICRQGKSEGIEFITTRHEAAAAHMADAVSRTSDQVGVCTGTVGPGAVNLATGIYVAYNDSIPVIAITPQIHSNRAYPFRGSMQQLNQKDLFRPITKWNAVVNSWHRIPELVQRAFRVATSGRPGPVHLDFFVDALFDTHDSEEVKLMGPQLYRTDIRPAGDPEAVEKAVEMLLAAQRPLIHTGGGVLRAKAWDELRELAEYLQIPVTTSVSGRGAMPEDHPLVFITKGGGAIMAEQNADVVLCVGTTMSEMDFWGEPPMWGDPEDQKFIYVDIDPEVIGLNRPIEMGITGDAKTVLRQILELVKERGPSPERIHIQEYREADDLMNSAFEEMAHSEARPVHPLRLVNEAVEFFSRDGIMVLDGGNIALWTNVGGRFYRPRTFLVPEGTGQLGVGLPMALGAKKANPDTPVYIIHGDGAFMLNCQEIETAVREKLPVVDIIANDYAWGMIKGVQEAAFDSRYYGVEFSEGARYDKLAEALGARGIRVEDPEDLRPALEEASSSDVMTVIDVVIDQEAHLCPPVVFDLVAELWLRGCDEPYCGG